MSVRQSSFYGGKGGKPYTLYPDKTSHVKHLKVWAGKSASNVSEHVVVKGIEVEWFNGEKRKVYNHPNPDDASTEYSFQNGETAVWTIRAGDVIDRLEFDTSTGQGWNAGGLGGSVHVREVGVEEKAERKGREREGRG
ncbi:hypothetical protein J3459_017584 [Metarhizium acridum]|uniref:Mannose-binding lectin n=2 Tax=Metarhizium acridum TaxID=92637 RepID=E9EFS8_METAQ|nr:uncharacterized protein MAC_08726 [Metarhizium acridum CQMa 102]EFY85215.1 hypothetical protein MAC_08726 [Metarhizium acridum CQMa 102]KAG8409408.1 hypothetical protein J3459_017584 [Metarhizium acridum]